MAERSFDQTVRIAAGILLLGAVLLLVAGLAEIPLGSVGTANRTAWVLIHLALVVGSVATLLALPVVYAAQRQAAGALGLIGFGLLFVGFLGLGFFIAAVQTFLLPWVYDKASCTLGCHLLNRGDGPPLFGAFYFVSQLATFVGLILLGVATVRAALFPRPTGLPSGC